MRLLRIDSMNVYYSAMTVKWERRVFFRNQVRNLERHKFEAALIKVTYISIAFFLISRVFYPHMSSRTSMIVEFWILRWSFNRYNAIQLVISEKQLSTKHNCINNTICTNIYDFGSSQYILSDGNSYIKKASPTWAVDIIITFRAVQCTYTSSGEWFLNWTTV